MTRLILAAFITLLPFACLQASVPDSSLHAATSPVIQQVAVNHFVLESDLPDLDIRVFDLEGKRIPCTLWKFKSHDTTRYETGCDLRQGIYVVRIQQGAEISYCKLIRRDS